MARITVRQSGDQVERPTGPNNRALAAAQTMAGAVVGLGLLGLFLDRRYESAPKFVLIGLTLGLAVGFYDLWKAMFPKKEDE